MSTCVDVPPRSVDVEPVHVVSVSVVSVSVASVDVDEVGDEPGELDRLVALHAVTRVDVLTTTGR